MIQRRVWILLIEVAKTHAPIWTEPRDLIVDPANPRKGIGWHWIQGMLTERACFAVFADGRIRMISEAIDDERLRQLLAGEGSDAMSLNWCLWPLRRCIFSALWAPQAPNIMGSPRDHSLPCLPFSSPPAPGLWLCLSRYGQRRRGVHSSNGFIGWAYSLASCHSFGFSLLGLTPSRILRGSCAYESDCNQSEATMFCRFSLACCSLMLILSALHAKDDYQLGADSMEQPGVLKGNIEQFKFKSDVFAGTVRDVWVYVPAQYDKEKPAAVMVFQDGGNYQNPKGQFRVPIVLDNLIHKKEIPVMIGIFINPGVFEGKNPKKGGSNRSFEYDTLSDQYARFLEKEILPEVGKKYNLRQDAAGRGIGGISSGGICAFTVAWERPDLFSKVLSHVGSFTNIRGGDRYPGMIRKTKNKPIRVFLQDGKGDLDNEHGNWWLGNLQMEASLKYKKYDYQTVWGDGGHNGKHGGAILPESMRWLWREDVKKDQ